MCIRDSVNGLQGLMGGLGGIATVLAKSPALTGAAIGGILAGKYLFSRGEQIAITTAGVAGGIKLSGGGLGGLMGGLGGAARGVGRLLPGLGAAVGVGSSAMMLGNEETRGQGLAGLGGAGIGALIGSMIAPGVGTLIGAGLGSVAGQMFGGGKQFGGGMDAGKMYLTGERGPELVTAGTSSAVTANNDLAKIFNTEALENKMTSMVNALNSANQSIANMANGVNTLVAVESRALKAVETTARKDRNQVGLV